jgi:serpin B
MNRQSRAVVLLCLGCLVLGCGRSEPGPAAVGGPADPEAGKRKPGFLTPELKAARERSTRENAAFSQELLAAAHEQKGNLAFATVGITMSLTMLDLLAKGETAEQVRKVAHLDDGQDGTREMTHVYAIDDMRSFSKAELAVVNGLWSQSGHSVEAYPQVPIKAIYEAQIDQVDFKERPDEARNEINQWVQSATNGRIPQLFGAGDIIRDTRLVVANTVYLKALWDKPFEPSQTRPLPFHLDADRAVDVPTMRRTGTYAVFAGDGYEALRLPYTGGSLAMIVLVPKSADQLQALETSLPIATVLDGLRKTKAGPVALELPRFKLESRLDLAPVLQALGMTRAFTPQAEFPTISDEPGGVYVSVMAHAGTVEVDEKGTVAAAATGAGLVKSEEPPEPRAFKVDRPFLFLIHDEGTNGLLFVGRVTDPRG